MTKYNELTIQLGKNGLSENFFSSLKTYFKNNQAVKVIVLQNFPERDQEKMRFIEEKIKENLGENFMTRKIGFTISVKKIRMKSFKNSQN